MPFFSKKKEKFNPEVEIPDFPAIEREKVPEFPPFEPKPFPSLQEIKQAVIPRRQPALPPLSQPPIGEIPLRKQFPIARKPPMPELAITKIEPVQRPIQEVRSFQQPIMRERRPLFVQIDEYNKALDIINNLKAKVNEVDMLLNNLNKIREQEEQQLRIWQSDLQKIKENLVLIDKKLFEFT